MSAKNFVQNTYIQGVLITYVTTFENKNILREVTFKVFFKNIQYHVPEKRTYYNVDDTPYNCTF